MQKIIRRVCALMVVAAAVICLGAFATACADNDEDYTVTVVYEDGTPVKGSDGWSYGESATVTISWCLDENGELITCYLPVDLDENGHATAKDLPELKENQSFHIQVNNLPQGYTYEEKGTYITGPGNVTVTLIAE